MITWIAVTSATRARIFQARGPNSPLVELADLVNPEERLQRKELRNDKPGRTNDAHRGQRHTLGMADDPHAALAADFAKSLMSRLADDLAAKRFDRLCLVAPPRFLGMLREKMTPSLRAVLIGEVTKDLTARDAGGLARDLEPVVWPRVPPVPGLPA